MQLIFWFQSSSGMVTNSSSNWAAKKQIYRRCNRPSKNDTWLKNISLIYWNAWRVDLTKSNKLGWSSSEQTLTGFSHAKSNFYFVVTPIGSQIAWKWSKTGVFFCKGPLETPKTTANVKSLIHVYYRGTIPSAFATTICSSSGKPWSCSQIYTHVNSKNILPKPAILSICPF